ncbi:MULTISPECIES: MlaD family protein [unclassified Nocardia]|uniref:MlaD family protein n=1 Tax=unclassified Nocardia TaxID=2637762 RepID=UPI001CE41078|nr:MULTISPECIES: MlaD family protein [unclassified Nocardia]
MRWRSVLSLGAIAVVFVLGASYLTFGVVRVDWFRHYLNLTMDLPNSGGLQQHSPVLLSGVPVGKVIGVETVEHAVRVRLRVEDTYRIPAASILRIENLSALGEPYLEFTPPTGGGPYLTDGARIDTHQVRSPLSIPEMATAATDLLGQLDPQAVGELVRTFTEGTSGVESALPQLNRAAELLAATLLGRQPQLRTMLTDLQTIGADMDWLGPSLEAGGPQWGRFGGRVRDVVDALEKLMRSKGFPEDYQTGTGLVPFFDQLAARLDRIGPEVRPLIPVLAPLTSSATGVLHTIDLSALISQALSSTDTGAVRLRIAVR